MNQRRDGFVMRNFLILDSNMDDATIREIESAVQRAFSSGVENKRYIDVSRVPLICQSIVGIDKKLEELVTQQEFWPVKTLVYGITAMMLAGVIGALLTLIITHK